MRTVQLLHTCPDGSSHVDWFIEPPGGDWTSLLVSYRCAAAVSLLGVGESMAIERTDDHRRRYLWYEGPLSEGRGNVNRLAAGVVRRWFTVRPDVVHMNVGWGGGKARRHEGPEARRVGNGEGRLVWQGLEIRRGRELVRVF